MLIPAFFVYLNYFQPLGIFLFRSFYALICQIIPGQFLSGKIFFLPDVLILFLGRKPAADVPLLFVFLQHLFVFGIRSMRQTIKEMEVNMAYRWFIGYDIGEDIPHFSTFSKNYSRRFKDTDVFEQIFMHILQEAIECGFVDASALFIDSMHVKANANKKKKLKKE